MRNNPMSGADPDGHCCWDWIKSHGKDIAIGIGKTIFNSLVPASAPLFDIWQGGVGPTSVNNPRMTPSNDTQAAAMVTTTVVVAAVAVAAPETESASVSATVPATPVLTGFSEAETGMIQNSLSSLAGAGYDTSAFQTLIRADMPTGYSAMSLSDSPTGAALGDGAFTSQEMLNHTLEEELLHLGQDLPNQSFGPGDAAAKEAEVEAARKFPAPQQ
jgi:hypothetical protein